jgi:hypothetical protein
MANGIVKIKLGSKVPFMEICMLAVDIGWDVISKGTLWTLLHQF